MDPDRSFERIYRRHRREVYGSVLRDVRDPDEAEDVTQAAFLNAFRAMRRGDEPETPRAWLLTIARNVVRRRARLRSERPQEVELDTDSELLVSLDEGEGSASADIHAALGRLTDAQREAILLREIQGRSYAEISFELGLSVSAVEALIFRARRSLAEELELVDRVPQVQVRPQRRHGLLAIPGLAKLGSFGFSFGRVAAACMVGCAVVATVPVMDGSASEEPVSKPRPAHAARAADPIVLHQQAPVVTAKAHKERKDSAPKGGKKKPPHSSSPAGSHEGSGGGGGESLLPVDLPPVEVELPPVEVEVPPVELPPVEVPPLPPVEVPPVQLPPVQLPPVQVELPPLPPLTS